MAGMRRVPAFRTPTESSGGPTLVIDLAAEDLPCPWCQAQTSEADPRCPSCGRRFGS